MADFYEVYNRITDALSSGQLREDQLDNNEQMIYLLGSNKAKYDDLSDQGRTYIDTYFGGGPSFLGDVKNEAVKGFEQVQHGIRQNPVYDAALNTFGGKVFPSPESGRYNYAEKPVDALVGAVKSGVNIPMGLARMQGAPASGAVETLYRNTRIPDNVLTRIPIEIGAGVMQDTAALAPVNTFGRITRLLTGKQNALRMAKETLAAPASGIEPVAAEGEKIIDPLAKAAEGVRVPTLHERALTLLNPSNRRTPYLDALEGLVSEAVRKDKAVLPIGAKADEVLTYAQTPEFRAWADQISSALEKKGYNKESISAFLRSRAKFMIDPGHVQTAEEYARSQVVKDITKLAEADPDMAEALGVVYKPKEPLGPDPQAGLFGRTESATPAHIRPTGPTTGTQWDVERVAPGQLAGRGVQIELNLPKPVAEAKRATETLDTVNSIVSGRDMDYWMVSKDPGFGQRLHNLFRKSISGLVTGPGTAARNAIQQAVKSGMEIPISAYQEILSGGSIDDAIKNVSNQLGASFDLKGATELTKLLPEAMQQRLGYKGMYGELIKPESLPTWGPVDKVMDKAFNWANYVNAQQEKYFWLRAFKGKIDGYKAKLGIEITDGQIPEAVLKEAYDFANDLTYARDMPKAFQEGWDKALNMPGVGLIMQEAMPFARFNYNAALDMLDFGPTGFYRAMMSGNSDEAARIIGKAMVGNKVLQEALRQKEVPSGEWYEMELPGLGKVDVRRWHPLDAYAMVAELIHRPMGSANSRVTKADLAQLLLGGNRLDDTMMGILVGMYQGESTQSIDRNLAQVAGSVLSRFVTPLKWAQLAQQGASLATTGELGESGVQRDLLTNRYGLGGALDRAASNIPGVSEGLPARIDPTTPETPGIKSFKELTAKLFGLDPVQTNRVKEELKRLKFTGPQGKDFGEHLAEQLGLEDQRFKTGELDVPKAGDFLAKLYARTGDPSMNRILNEHMSKTGSKILEGILDTPAYEGLSDAKRRLIMDEVIVGLKAAFRQSQKQGVTPYQAIDNWLRTKTPSLRGLLDELARQQRNPNLRP